MNGLWRDAHLLTKQFADFAGQQRIINANRTGLRTAAAQAATIYQLRQSINNPPVQFQIGTGPFSQQFSGGCEITPVDSPQKLRPVIGSVNVLVAALWIDRAGIVTCIALHAIIGGQNGRLKKTPVIFFTKDFFQPFQKIIDDFRLFFGRLGNG